MTDGQNFWVRTQCHACLVLVRTQREKIDSLVQQSSVNIAWKQNSNGEGTNEKRKHIDRPCRELSIAVTVSFCFQRLKTTECVEKTDLLFSCERPLHRHYPGSTSEFQLTFVSISSGRQSDKNMSRTRSYRLNKHRYGTLSLLT